MQFNILFYTLFLFVTVMVFPSLIFAPWTPSNPPRQPLPGEHIRLTCAQWIEYSGFTLNDYDENVRLTRNRNVKLDREAYRWAAIYAFHIGGINAPRKLLPEQFCKRYRYDDISYSFTPLNAEFRTCQGWILYYGFKEHKSTYNIAHANNQVLEKMFEVSIWAYSYYKYIIRLKNAVPMKPSEFCDLIMGTDTIENPNFKGFISTHEPQLTCQEWLKQYEYTDNIQNNFDRAIESCEAQTNPNIKIHYFTKLYATYLRSIGKNAAVMQNITPLKYCREHIRATDSTTYNFHYIFWNLTEPLEE